MPASPPSGMPRITPSLFYDDPSAALDWIAKAFAFEVKLKVPGPDGGIIHSEMQLGDGVIFVGATSGTHFMEGSKSPRSIGGSVTQSLYVYVDDVDAHCRRARRAGAKILHEPRDQFYGDRTYTAADLEGHIWTFGQHVRDVAPEDLHPPAEMH